MIALMSHEAEGPLDDVLVHDLRRRDVTDTGWI